MINNSSNSNNTKNEIVLISATLEQIPSVISDTKLIIDNIDIVNTTLCCLILFNKFCIMILFIEKIIYIF
jgi:hypothetical protein